MQGPLLHLNGTSFDELLGQLTEAGSSVNAAVRALEKAAPNQRDYYPLGPDAWGAAQREHASRLARLLSVRDELEQLALALDEQHEEQEERS
jgi:hypothetical protein